MKIGELAKRTGCPITRIRFYEQKGLLPPPARTYGNQRNYGEEAVERLNFITTCRANGMKLECIARFIEFEQHPEKGDAWLLARIDKYLEQATKVQEQAQRAEVYLKHLRECFPQKVLEQSSKVLEQSTQRKA